MKMLSLQDEEILAGKDNVNYLKMNSRSPSFNSRTN